MGSLIMNTPTMAEDKKKTIKGLIKNIFGKKTNKDHITKENTIEKCETVRVKQPEKIEVSALIQNFKKIEIERKKEAEKKEAEKKEEDDEWKNFSFKTVADNDLENFTYKVVEEDRRTERTDSHSSQDSGYSEKDLDCSSEDITRHDDVIEALHSSERNTKENDFKQQNGGTEHGVTESQNGDAKTDDIIDSLESLKLEDSKKKKCHLVPVSRGPVRNRLGDISGTYHPYVVDTQINTVNKQTFSGGQVIVANRVQEFTEVEVPLKKDSNEELQSFDDGLALRGVQFNQLFDLDLVQEYIDEKSTTTESDLLEDFLNQSSPETLQTITNLVEKHMDENQHNPIEELENTNHLNYEKIDTLDTLLGLEKDRLYANMFPSPPSSEVIHSPPSNEFYTNLLTPPRSETIPSPMSDTSIYPTNSEYTLSPNSDCEKYQDIPQYYDEIQNAPEEFLNEKLDSDTDKKTRERNTSTSSLSMKNFKDMQKELAARFSKKECCKTERRSCKELFLVHMKKLKAEERKSLCLKVSSMDLKTCNGVLHHILIGLSRGDVDVDLHMALFALICEKVLGTDPGLFTDEFGLDLLKAASLRCPQRPLLTRLVVHCIRTVLRSQPAPHDGKEALFKEMDALGDTLVIALARGGDTYAAALADILRADPGERPLFDVQHVNTEGYSALHVSSREHSVSSPRLHTAHALLEHGAADIWKGDVKGGDTAVHMAVNSATCDLSLVLLLFKHLDRKEWKKLAHAPNRSSVTPLDYARCAVKSTTRHTYPSEVLDFLKKCR